MNKSTYHIALEIDRHISQGSMSVRRGESGRELVLTLLSGGKPYDPGEGAYAVLAAKKPDGTTLFNGCLLKNGRIHYILTAQTTAVPGRAECEARIYDANGELIVSPKFALVIYKTAIEDEEVASSSEATALTALVSEAKRALEDIDAAGISACEVTVDANSGAPSALAEMKADARGKILALTFSGLKGADGANGAPGEKGEKGDRGEIGPAFTYADFTPEQLAALKGEKGEAGIDGKDGAPGEKGDKGDTGERGEKGDKGDTGATGATGAQGAKGDKGDKGDTFTFDDLTSAQIAALKGDKGDTGEAGHTPVRGTDYWTAEDQTAIVNAVLDALPSGDEVSY